MSLSPAACSGLMYVGVPIATPVPVRLPLPTSVSALAIPKSVTITRRRVPSNRMLSGLMSRWMIPIVCAIPNASDVSFMIRRTSSMGSFPLRLSRAPSGSPSTNPMTK